LELLGALGAFLFGRELTDDAERAKAECDAQFESDS
jgi:hypothetical protein